MYNEDISQPIKQATSGDSEDAYLALSKGFAFALLSTTANKPPLAYYLHF